ncbi:alpha-ketoglutarate-dependent dioxygenase AlkB [Tardiphaga sp.]|jgi:alkylated DNA repair dioxygenase AlkB|uniref:alpha-ketoglutarate-dependent dioxygenase AlkB n=1 Tax=Tardiphaga sp. TaxID=1926292 RepID=UPI0037D9D325
MEQLDIFGGEADGPAGFRYAREFVSEREERDLVHEIARLPLEPFQFGAFEGKRQVASFGFSYDYTLRRLKSAAPIPHWLDGIIDRVERFGGTGTQISQALCTEYDVGAGIGWHRDKPHFNLVFGLSLGAPCKLRFRRRLGSGWQRFTVDAEPRSLYLMSGPSRDIWEHSIAAVGDVRYSVTFRTMQNTSPPIHRAAP